MISPLPRTLLEPFIRRAFEEDLAQGGDLTTLATIDPEQTARAELRLRQPGCIAGTDLAVLAFQMMDADIHISTKMKDGDIGEAGASILSVQGKATSLLMAERTALNFLTLMSGIATLTTQYTDRIQGTKARIAATRKTLPGLRVLQKHAVRAGGGMTHRMSLSDAVMIKDNHIAAAGGIAAAIEAARHFAGHTVKIEVEVDRLDQLEEALPARPDIVLLDNMEVPMLQQAVSINKGRSVLEASGGVSLDTVGAIAQTGVDVISVGALTHSAPALDIGMDLET